MNELMLISWLQFVTASLRAYITVYYADSLFVRKDNDSFIFAGLHTLQLFITGVYLLYLSY